MSYQIQWNNLIKVEDDHSLLASFTDMITDIENYPVTASTGPIQDTWPIDIPEIKGARRDTHYSANILNIVYQIQHNQFSQGEQPSRLFELHHDGAIVAASEYPPVVCKVYSLHTDFGPTIVFTTTGSGAEGEQADCLSTETGSSPVASAILNCPNCGREYEMAHGTVFKGDNMCYMCAIGWIAKAGMTNKIKQATALDAIIKWTARVSPNSVDFT